MIIHSGVPIIDYNQSLIENLKRRDNRLWKLFNRLSREKKVLSAKKKVLLYKPFFRTVSCDQKYCKILCMKAEQPEKTHLEESARSETQLHSQGPLSIASFTCCHETNMEAYRWNSYKEIFLIIIDDRSVGSI